MAAGLAPITKRLDDMDGRLDGVDKCLTRIERTQAIVSTHLSVSFISNLYPR